MNEIFELLPKNFPPLLKEIPDKPRKLYYRGTIPNYNKLKLLCVVGSRKYSDYGRAVTEKLIGGLSGYKIAIVSGLALGIDSIAHESALRAGLTTIAVPGSGLENEVLYPRSNLSLAKRILENGGILISEFESGMKAAPYMFPQRNRIMAGMSEATIIIEAEEKSGTLITGRLAMEYNRDLLTVPGSIFSENTKGPHSLIRDGAALVRNAEDILSALHLEEIGVKEKEIDCSPEEIRILEILREPISKDDLLEEAGISPSLFNVYISSLEIKGLIRESLGKIHRI